MQIPSMEFDRRKFRRRKERLVHKNPVKPGISPLLLGILILFGWFSPAAALLSEGGQASTSVGEMKIIAGYQERVKERVFAAVDVEIHYRNIRLFADRVELNTETKDVMAEGNVVLQLPEEVISADRAFFNLDSSRGELHQVFGQIQPTIFYEAETIEKKQGNLYGFKNVRVTSCTQPVPRWNFSASRANFKKGDYMELWNAVFAVKKVPVFYLPYMKYPLDRERATGFLMPQAGYSGPKGFFFGQSFYWAIQRNMDATFNVDYYSARGIGGGLEYRYLFSGGTGGQLNAYYFIFKQDPEAEPDAPKQPNAYLIRLNHNQPLPFNFSLVADVDYQASFDFLREFDNNFRRAVVSNRRSQVYLSRSWSSYHFSARASRMETYFAEIDNSIITYYLPQISFNSFKIRLFSPLYFSFSSSFSNWRYGWESNYKLGREQRSQSLAFSPVLSLPFSGIPWLTMNASAEGNLNYYFQSFAPGTTRVVDEPIFSQNFALNLDFSGPVFYRIFEGAEGEAKFKHIVEPSASYRYESPTIHADRIITAYGFFRYHQIRYGLTNRVLVKEATMPREVFTLGLDQTFYFNAEESPLSVYRVDGEIPRFSDLGAYIRFYPVARYSLDASAGFNPYHKTFSSIRLGAGAGSPADPIHLRVSWYKSMNPYYPAYLWNRHQISFYGDVKIPRLGLEAQADLDFNIEERKMLYSGFALVYHYQCLDFSAELKIFFFRDKPETQFRISVGLGNIGKTTDVLGGLGF